MNNAALPAPDAPFQKKSNSGVTVFDHQRDGVLGGGHIGYNWLLESGWLLGFETDISGADIRGNITNCVATGCAHADGRTGVLGTARGRVGFVQDPETYTYAGPVTNPTAGDRNISSRLDCNMIRSGVNYRFAP